MDERIDILARAADNIGVNISGEQQSKFMEYERILLDWNSRMNLTAITEHEDIVLKHFVDSLTILPYIKGSVVDVGTGAGFPGIPVSIMKEPELLLLDSLNKRLVFLKEVIERLGLKNVSCLHARAEEAGRDDIYRERYDTCVSRAVARLDVLCEFCLPFVRVGGVFIAMKGKKDKTMEEYSPIGIRALGGRLEDMITVDLPYTDISRTLIIVSKIRHTPNDYPRNITKITKSPII